jgi:uncharacterized protein
MTTYTGKTVNPLDLRPEDIDVADIAHALACVNRFAGHAIKPISVAQHSVYVSRLLEDTLWARQALFHDASEAYLGDVTKWLKHSEAMAGYRVAEDRAQRVIFEAFHIEPEMHYLVEKADKLMVRFEARKAFGQAWDPFEGYPDPTMEELAAIGKWAAWPWRAAEEAFLVQFRRLGGHVSHAPLASPQRPAPGPATGLDGGGVVA